MVTLKAVSDRVIVEFLDECEKQTKSGLVVPPTARRGFLRARVLAVGPGRVLTAGIRKSGEAWVGRAPMGVWVGDVVWISRDAGAPIEGQDGKEVRAIFEGDIWAVEEYREMTLERATEVLNNLPDDAFSRSALGVLAKQADTDFNVENIDTALLRKALTRIAAKFTAKGLAIGPREIYLSDIPGDGISSQVRVTLCKDNSVLGFATFIPDTADWEVFFPQKSCDEKKTVEFTDEAVPEQPYDSHEGELTGGKLFAGPAGSDGDLKPGMVLETEPIPETEEPPKSYTDKVEGTDDHEAYPGTVRAEDLGY